MYRKLIEVDSTHSNYFNLSEAVLRGSCAVPKDYWSNTSGNDVVRHFIESAGNEKTKNEIEALVAGETVEKEIHEDLTYNHLYDTIYRYGIACFKRKCKVVCEKETYDSEEV